MGFLKKMFGTRDTPELQRPRSSAAAQGTVEIDVDLRAMPISRERMDLLWLPPGNLEVLRAFSQGGHNYGSVSTIGAGGGFDQVIATLFTKVHNGEVSLDDINWAIEVDAIAANAEKAGQAERYFDAIRYYREALRLAPGCDLYLMSMGSCYAGIDQLGVSLRYMQRAAEISPSNPRIARNLKSLKERIADNQRR